MRSDNSIIHLLYWMIGICLLGSCNDTSIVKIPTNGFSTTPLKKWVCIGPFEFDTIAQDPVRTLYNQDLKSFEIDEENFKKSDIKLIPNTTNIFEIEDKEGTVDLMKYAGDKKKLLSNYYLYSEVKSETDQEVVFITDGSFGYKMWLNGILIISDYWKKNTNKGGDRLIPVTLKKGINTIFAKVNRGNNEISWKLNLTISNTEEAKKVFFENCLSDFIANPNFLDSLSVYVGPFQKGKIEISDTGNNVVFFKEFIKGDIRGGYVNVHNLHTLPDGFYTVKLMDSTYKMEEKAYKGPLDHVKVEIENLIPTLKCDSSYKKEILASFNKFKYLINVKPDSLSRYEKQYWRNNSVFYGYNTLHAINHLQENQDLKGCPGTIIKSYFSEKDQKYHEFLFHCTGTPEEIASKPVILMIPYALEGNDFTTSWYFSSLDQLEIDAHLAEKNGFSIAWLFLRGSDYTLENADEDVYGAIQRLVTDYGINPNSFFLDGDCVGGYRSLLIASRNPHLFTGVAAHGPVTQGENDYGPINLVRNLTNVSICIVHSHDDKVVPIQQTKIYIKEANKFGVHPVLDEKFNKGKHSLSKAYHYDSFQKLKEFYTNRKNQLPKIIQYCTYDNSEKSIYWMDIVPESIVDKAEISIKYDTINHKFNIKNNGIEEITIHTKLLGLNNHSRIIVHSNNEQVYNGIANYPTMKVKLN